MALETECRGILQFDTLQGIIEERTVRRPNVRGQAIFINGKTMVLTGDHDLAAVQILHRVVGAMMTDFHFYGAGTGRQAQSLVTQANAENRHLLFDEGLNGPDGIVARLRISGAV